MENINLRKATIKDKALVIDFDYTLSKVGFSFAGKIDGLDEGDPELFYYKKLNR